MDQELFTAHIYQIYCHCTGYKYIGSTTKTVKQRLKKHEYAYCSYKKGNHNYISSFDVLENEDYDISTLETVNVTSLKELHRIEGSYIKLIDCVNKYVAGQTRKQYAESHKEQIKAYAQKYRDNNRDKIDIQLSKSVKCECGCDISARNIAKHRKSNKHFNNLLGLKLF